MRTFQQILEQDDAIEWDEFLSRMEFNGNHFERIKFIDGAKGVIIYYIQDEIDMAKVVREDEFQSTKNKPTV